MTARERAKQSIERSALPPHFSQWWAIAVSPEQTEALIQSIEQTIIAARIEARAKGVAEGREAAAKMLDWLASNKGVYADMCEQIAKMIRGEQPARYSGNIWPGNLIHVRRKNHEFELLLNLVSVGFLTEAELITFKDFAEKFWESRNSEVEWTEIVLPRLRKKPDEEIDEEKIRARS